MKTVKQFVIVDGERSDIVNPDELQPFQLQVSDGTMVEVIQETDGTVKPTAKFMDEVKQNMMKEDPTN